jgi:hypothetical protein
MLTSYQHAYMSTIGALGMASIEGSVTNTGSDVGAQGSSDESSVLDDDLSGAIAHAAAGMSTGIPPHLLMGVDYVTSWMSNNTLEYLNMCMPSVFQLPFSPLQFDCTTANERMHTHTETDPLFFHSIAHYPGFSMGRSDSDQSDTQSLPPTLGDAPPLASSPGQGQGTGSSGYGSDGGFDDDDEDETDTDEGEGREGKRSRVIRKPRRSATSSAHQELDTNRALPQWFRPLVKDGEVQFEIWIIAFLKPQLIPSPLKSATGNEAISKQQRDSQWTEAVNELLESNVMQQFVKSEVADGRIGIDFKRIMADKKDRRKATRRVIR